MQKEFITLPLDELIPYENNPRINDNAVHDVKLSIQQCENLDPIEIDENNVILSGHTRLIALTELGYTESEVLRISGLTDEQKRKYRILANKTNELAEWDFEKLSFELEELDFSDFDLEFDVDLSIDEPNEIIEDDVPEVDEEAEPICKLGDIWHADLEGYNFRGACADNNWKVRECLIWNKNSMVLGRQDYQWKHEPCLYGWKDGASHLWASDRKQTTVLNFDRPNRADLHPTMKPIKLFAYQIGNNTHEGDSVLDLFGGSGSTLIACEQLNRKCYMAELDPKYCDVILQRYINFKGPDADVFLLKDGEKIPWQSL